MSVVSCSLSPQKKFKEVVEEAFHAHFLNICLRLVSSLTVLSLFPTEKKFPKCNLPNNYDVNSIKRGPSLPDCSPEDLYVGLVR